MTQPSNTLKDEAAPNEINDATDFERLRKWKALAAAYPPVYRPGGVRDAGTSLLALPFMLVGIYLAYTIGCAVAIVDVLGLHISGPTWNWTIATATILPIVWALPLLKHDLVDRLYGPVLFIGPAAIEVMTFVVLGRR